MSGSANTAQAGGQDKGDEESLAAPVTCGGGPSDHHGTQTPAVRSNGSYPHRPDPALIGLVRLLARQAARERFEAARLPEDSGGELE